MEHFRKVWDDEKDAWLKAHKDMARKDAYALFCKVFHDEDISKNAFNTRRSVVGAAKYQRRGRCRALALYSERVKRGCRIRRGAQGKGGLNRYNKSAVPKLPKKRGGKAMKRYDQNFKVEALKLSDDIGVKKACEQLNVTYGTLAGWRKQRVKKNKERKSTEADIHKENSRLKKEIAELKNANDILKDALTFFVQDRKK